MSATLRAIPQSLFMTWRSIVQLTSRDDSPSAQRSVARVISVVCLVGSLAIQSAHAIPIGDFSWNEHTEDDCAAGLCGPFFSVGNLSTVPDLSLGSLGDSFFDVFVDLLTGAGPVSLDLGPEIAPFDSRQSIDDLFGQVIVAAGLRLTFAAPTLPGSVRLLDAAGNVAAGLTAPGTLQIDYLVDEIVVSVPEPSTLLMLAGGLIGVAVGRRAQQGNATLQTSRTKQSSRHVFAT